MEDTRRKPTQEVFDDIVEASVGVWSWDRDYHQDYINEKLEKIWATENYADNWNSIVGMFDQRNQILMHARLKLQASVDFLNKMSAHYRISMPREKK